eukprot:scaffold253221_cov15-Tisochrysis_lutea.AAC.1
MSEASSACDLHACVSDILLYGAAPLAAEAERPWNFSLAESLCTRPPLSASEYQSLTNAFCKDIIPPAACTCQRNTGRAALHALVPRLQAKDRNCVFI